MTEPDSDTPVFDLHLDSSGDAPLVDVVYNALRDAIVDGRLVAGQRLPQIPIADQLGISRTPVRDALQRLAQEGLVRVVSFRGFEVSDFSAREVIDIYQVRLALEPVVVGEALPHYSRMDIAELEDICDRTEKIDVEDVNALYALNAQFHRKMIEPCPNRIAVRILTQLWQQPSSLRMFHAQASLGTAMKSSTSEHRQIVEAISTGDSDLFLKRTTDHIRDAQRETIEALAEQV